MISRDALAAALGQTEGEWELQGPQQVEERELRLRRSQEQQKQDAKLQAQKLQTLLKGTQPRGKEQCQGIPSRNQMFATRVTQGNMEGEQFHGDPAAALLQKYREKFAELQNSFLSLRNERATLKEQHTALIEEHRSVEESLQRIAAEVEDLKSRESADASSTAFLAHFIAAALRCFLETAATGGSIRDVMRGLRSEMEALQMPSSSDPRLLSCYTRLKKCDTGLRSAAADAGKEAQGNLPQQQKQDCAASAQQQEVSTQQPQKPSEDAVAAPTPQKEQDEQQQQQQSSAEQQQQRVEPPQQQKEKEQRAEEDGAEASRSLQQTPSPAEDDTVSIRRRYTSPHGTKFLSSALHICGLPEAARRRSATALGSGTVSLAAQFAVAARAPVPREEHTPMLLPEFSQEQQQQQENTGTTVIKAFCTWPRPSCPSLTGGKSVPKGYADVAQERQDSTEQQQQQQQESRQFEEQGLQQPSPSATRHAFASHGESTEAHLPGTDRRGSREGSAAFPFLSRSAAPCFSVNSTNSCSSLAASPVSPVSSFFLPPPASLPGSAERKAILPRAAAGAPVKSAWQSMAGAADRRSMVLQTQQLQQQLAQLQLQLQHLEMHLQQQTLGNFVHGGNGGDADVETAESVAAAAAAQERRSCSEWLSVPRRSRRQEHLRQKQQQEAGLTGAFSPFAAASGGSFGGRKSTLSRSSSAYSSTEALDGSSGVRSLDLESCCSCSSAAAFPRRPSRGGSGRDCSPAEERRTTKTQRQHDKQQPERSSRRSSGVEGDVGCLQNQQQQERSRSSCSNEQQPKALRSCSSSGRRESTASTIPSVFQHLAEQQKQQPNDPRVRHPHYRLRSPLQRRQHPQIGEKQQEEFQRWRMQPQHSRWQQGQPQGRCWDPREDESEEETWRWGLIEPCPSRKDGSGGTLNSVSSPAGVPLSSCASAGPLGTGGLLAVRRTILELERQKKSEEQQQPSPYVAPQLPSSQQRPSAAQQQRQQGHWNENDKADKTCALQEALRRQEEALLQQQTTARQLQKALHQQQEALKAAAVGAAVATQPNGNPAGVVDSAGAPPEAAATAAAEIAAFHAKSRQQQLEEVWLRVTQLQAQIIANTENPWLLQQLMLVPGSTNRATLGKCETLRGFTAPSTRL